MSCKFVLSDFNDDELQNVDGYHIFEPTLTLEIDGRNAFQSLGIEGVRNVVFMHFLEKVIDRTVEMVSDIQKNPEGEYECWLYGTGFGITAERKGLSLHIRLKVDGRMGPVQSVEYPRTVAVGSTTVDEWVMAVLSVSRTLSELFWKVNRVLYEQFEIERGGRLSTIELWLHQRQKQI